MRAGHMGTCPTLRLSDILVLRNLAMSDQKGSVEMPSKRVFRLISLLTATFLLAPSFHHLLGQSSGPSSHRRWEFTTFGGTSVLGDHTFITPVQGGSQPESRQVELSYDSSYMFGIRVLQGLNESWATEFEYNFASQPMQFSGLMPDTPPLHLDHLVHRFNYDLVLFVVDPTKRLRPFVTGGAGISFFQVGGSSKSEAAALTGVALKDRWQFTFNWGGGVKYLLKDHWALRFDLRDMITEVPDYGFPSSALVVGSQFTPGFAPSGSMHGWQYSLGISYQWDGW